MTFSTTCSITRQRTGLAASALTVASFTGWPVAATVPPRSIVLSSTTCIHVPAARWPALVSAAPFPHMRARAIRLAQGRPGILIDDAGFFRAGRSGAGRDTLSEAECAGYEAKAAGMAPADALDWLHR
jgi:hypothetical protein